MFERYTERARRAIFFARYEASQFGDEAIETYHLLLGILREDEELKSQVLGTGTLDELRTEFAHFATETKIATSVDLPLSHDAKRALVFGAEEAELAGSRIIDSEHLLAGLLHEPNPAFEALQKRGITLQTVRGEFFGAPPVESQVSAEFLVGALPRDRRGAALRILEALRSEQVTIHVTTPKQQFSISFPTEEPPPAESQG